MTLFKAFARKDEKNALANESGFSVRQTNIAKGIACILLLFHHLFYSQSSYDYFTSLMLVNDVPLESIIAVLCKICVAIFLFLSGYGINASINKKLSFTSNKDFFAAARVSLRFMWRLWANYIIIFALFVPWQGLFGRDPYTCFSDTVIDLLGLSYLFKTPTMNATWWYISIALLSYATAIFYKPIVVKYKSLAFAIAISFFVLSQVISDMFICYIFMFGMLFNETKAFDLIAKKKSVLSYKWAVCLILVLCFALLSHKYPVMTYLPFALSIILFSFFCASKIKYVNAFLEFFGKHSANIFLFHTFLYAYNFKSFVYAPKYAPLILIIFAFECLLISVLIEFVKSKALINKGINTIEASIAGKA